MLRAQKMFDWLLRATWRKRKAQNVTNKACPSRFSPNWMTLRSGNRRLIFVDIAVNFFFFFKNSATCSTGALLLVRSNRKTQGVHAGLQIFLIVSSEVS